MPAWAICGSLRPSARDREELDPREPPSLRRRGVEHVAEHPLDVVDGARVAKARDRALLQLRQRKADLAAFRRGDAFQDVRDVDAPVHCDVLAESLAAQQALLRGEANLLDQRIAKLRRQHRAACDRGE